MAIKVLVAYTSNTGSTAEVAQFIGQELGRDGAQGGGAASARSKMSTHIRRWLWAGP